MKTQLNVVIPVYNEEKIIETVIYDWIKTLDNLNIIYKIKIYNDGSKDSTLKKVKKIEKENSTIIEVIDKKNSGHGSTILKGYLESLNADWIFQVDSDNEMKAKHFKKLWDDREKYDFLIGKRINRSSNSMRKLMTYVSFLVVKYYYGKGIKDVNCPYRLMRCKSVFKIINHIPKDIFTPNIIISGMVIKESIKFNQYDIPFQTRTTGINSLNSNIFNLLKIAFRSFSEIISYAKKHNK